MDNSLTKQDLIEKARALGISYKGKKADLAERIGQQIENLEEERKEKNQRPRATKRDRSRSSSNSTSDSQSSSSESSSEDCTRKRGRSVGKGKRNKRHRRTQRRRSSSSSSRDRASSEGRRGRRELPGGEKENLRKQAEPIQRAIRKLDRAKEQLRKRKYGKTKQLLKAATRALDERLLEIQIASIHSWAVVDQMKLGEKFGGSKQLQKRVERAAQIVAAKRVRGQAPGGKQFFNGFAGEHRARSVPFDQASGVTVASEVLVSDAEPEDTLHPSRSASQRISRPTSKNSNRKRQEPSSSGNESSDCGCSTCQSNASPQAEVNYLRARTSELQEPNCSQTIFGSLRNCIAFWEEIGTCQNILQVIREGYNIPLVATPPPINLPNNKSAKQRKEFVTKEVSVLLSKGLVLRSREKLHCINPLTVADNGSKLRLVLDLSVFNMYVQKAVFRMEDIRTLLPFLKKEGFLIKFDLKSGYHHVLMRPNNYTFLGFQWEGQYYVFTVLCFGLTSGPYIFTKLLRPLIKRWRAMGIPVAVYIDDGAATLPDRETCRQASHIMQTDLRSAGFFTALPKCQWEPVMIMEWLGVVLDLSAFEIRIPRRRIEACLFAIWRICANKGWSSARAIASLVGQIISMSIVLGPLTQLCTRFCHIDVLQRATWDKRSRLSTEAVEEIMFWREHLAGSNKRKLGASTREFLLIYSDASATGGAATVNIEGVEQISIAQWSEEEQKSSSTFRELQAVWFALRSFGPLIRDKAIQWNTDNKAITSIIPKGSMKTQLHAIALNIFRFCIMHRVSLSVQWIPRGENDRADQLSRIQDWDDWQVSQAAFEAIQQELACVPTFDRFADHQNTKCAKFNSKVWVPGTSGVNAFAFDWLGEVNWLVPPINCICKAIDHIRVCACDAVLVVPAWRSAVFWPKLFPLGGQCPRGLVRAFVFPGKNVFCAGTQKSSIFSSRFQGEVLVAHFRAFST